jgi:hypothetical protein
MDHIDRMWEKKNACRIEVWKIEHFNFEGSELDRTLH